MAPSAGQKAALTRKRRAAAQRAVQTRRRLGAFAKARAAEPQAKRPCGCTAKTVAGVWHSSRATPARREPGIIDAIAFRLGRKDSDLLDVRLIQLKGGKAGVSGQEIARLKNAAARATVKWLIAEFDGDTLHLLAR